jgi:CheY-like chemotaxis protein
MDFIHILLADDDADDRFFFKRAFSKASIPADVVTVEDGQQLTELLGEIKEPPPPDIIFLDINMPRKNGKACLQEIRNDDKFKNTPVVMFSTSSYHKDIDETYEGGANLYISKTDFFGNEAHMLKQLFPAGWRQSMFNNTRENFVLKHG